MVQHMPKGFTNSLAMRLNEMSQVTVKEAADGDVLQKGWVYIAPGGKQMRVLKVGGTYKIAVTDEPARDALKPCANIMYESLVCSNFDEITCVVLTGMGADGTIGIGTLGETINVHVIAQDEATSVVYGMPKAIAEANIVDEVLPLEKIADAITKNVGVLNNGR
jgi:two-component system chemotaxis response regulator CheB